MIFRKKCDVVVSQAMWLKLVRQVIRGVEIGEPVNMSALITNVLIPHDQFFCDVWEVMKVLLHPKAFLFDSVDEMMRSVRDVIDCIERHAAVLMAVQETGAHLSPAKFEKGPGMGTFGPRSSRSLSKSPGTFRAVGSIPPRKHHTGFAASQKLVMINTSPFTRKKWPTLG